MLDMRFNTTLCHFYEIKKERTYRRFQLKMCYVKKVTFQERQKTDFHQNCSLDFYQTLTFIFIFRALSIVLTKNMQY